MTVVRLEQSNASSVASKSPSTGRDDWPPRGGCNLRTRAVRVLRAIALSSCARTHTHTHTHTRENDLGLGRRGRDLLSALSLWIISLFIVATKVCPISPTISKSRDIASRASTASAGEGSGIQWVALCLGVASLSRTWPQAPRRLPAAILSSVLPRAQS
jgi:hypothetical protein